MGSEMCIRDSPVGGDGAGVVVGDRAGNRGEREGAIVKHIFDLDRHLDGVRVGDRDLAFDHMVARGLGLGRHHRPRGGEGIARVATVTGRRGRLGQLPRDQLAEAAGSRLSRRQRLELLFLHLHLRVTEVDMADVLEGELTLIGPRRGQEVIRCPPSG